MQSLEELDYKRQYRPGLGLQERGSFFLSRSFTVCSHTGGEESSREGDSGDEEQGENWRKKSHRSMRMQCRRWLCLGAERTSMVSAGVTKAVE